MRNVSDIYGIKIIFETNDFILIHKPAGIAVQSRDIAGNDLEHIIVNKLATEGKRSGEKPYVAVINRLDKPVEGLVLFAKNKKAAANLTKQLTDGIIKKEYLAVVDGALDKRSAELCDHILKDEKTNFSRIVDKDIKNAKMAKLAYECIKTDGQRSFLKIRLYTGRRHQIRVQLANAGIPIAGDKKYNLAIQNDIKYPALCAAGLIFRDPKSDKVLSFEIKPTSDIFKHFIEEI